MTDALATALIFTLTGLCLYHGLPFPAALFVASAGFLWIRCAAVALMEYPRERSAYWTGILEYPHFPEAHRQLLTNHRDGLLANLRTLENIAVTFENVGLFVFGFAVFAALI